LKLATTAAILDFASVDYLTNAYVDWSDLFVAYWGDGRKVPFDDQHRRSLRIVTTPPILDLVSIGVRRLKSEFIRIP
jgi:hypothetical protein